MALQLTSYKHVQSGARFGAAYGRVMVANLRFDYDPQAAVIHLGIWPNATSASETSQPLTVHTYTASLAELEGLRKEGDKGDVRPAIYRWLKRQHEGRRITGLEKGEENMKRKTHAANKALQAKALAGVEHALTFAKLLDTPDPAEQVQRIETLLLKAVSPVLTLVIQADTRNPEGVASVLNLGTPIPGPMANMMLAAAQRELAHRQAEADVKAQAAKAPAAKNGKASP